VFKGRTDNSNSLTIKGVFAGEHTLKLVYGSVSHEQKIVVNSGNISFRQNVNIAASEPQFVVFTVVPQSAVVIIDGKHYTLQDGSMSAVLASGRHDYTVTAVGYHSQSGTFTVSGETVNRSITLKSDSANVTLTAPDNAEIWVNGEKKGTGRWSGMLNSGAYIFEARKDGYRTAKLTKEITSAQPQQSYTLPAPTPILGGVAIASTPIGANVTIDGKMVGTTPLKLDNIFVGNHSVKITKTGYSDYTQTVTIDEGKTVTINTTLTKQTATSTTISPTAAKGKTSAPYKVGDYYNDGKKEGVVFEVSADGKHGKIVSMTQSAEYLQWSTDTEEQKRLIGANSNTEGAINMAKVKAISGWKRKYPAFKWCADLGDGWYLPAIGELKKFTINDTIHNAVNRTLAAKGANKLCNRGEYECYWSSTEEDLQFGVVFCAWLVDMSNGDTTNFGKYGSGYVRAVSAF
ncbi:MAG: PEGA domain-containing protein, partial [Alistipes sp.]|nr:PEGA domain-containing protein [Alistipes sp.]